MAESSIPARIVVISPVKDEAQYLQRTINSMLAQTLKPVLWIIVNDGSSDATGAIADEAAASHEWIQVVHRPQQRQRRVGPGVIDAFYDGLSRAESEDYEYLCKLDGDLEFQPRYFETLIERFENNPRLGTASGKCSLVINGKLVEERSGDEFSAGPAKLYRRQCFEEIGGFVHEVMWDGIDCHRCRMCGWEAMSFPDAELRILHLRQMGSSHRSVFHGRLRWGRGQYFMGTHPLYVAGIGAYRMLERPWILGGLCIVAGYCLSWIQRRPRFSHPGFRQHLHRWQLNRLTGGLIPRMQPTPAVVGASTSNVEAGRT